MRSSTAALVQMCARVNEPDANRARALALVDQAVARSAAPSVAHRLPSDRPTNGVRAARECA
ncbi:MAG: hypothetical protein AAF721_20415 [Myxococcota bacterium]